MAAKKTTQNPAQDIAIAASIDENEIKCASAALDKATTNGEEKLIITHTTPDLIDEQIMRLRKQVGKMENDLLKDIIDIHLQYGKDDDINYGDFCISLLNQLNECYDKDATWYVPIIEGSTYEGSYLAMVNDDGLYSKDVVEINGKLYERAFTSPDLVDTDSYIGMSVHRIVLEAMVENNIVGLTLNGLVIEKEELASLMGFEK